MEESKYTEHVMHVKTTKAAYHSAAIHLKSVCYNFTSLGLNTDT